MRHCSLSEDGIANSVLEIFCQSARGIFVPVDSFATRSNTGVRIRLNKNWELTPVGLSTQKSPRAMPLNWGFNQFCK